MNFLERVISVFSPKWACERAAYRDVLSYRYEAGEINRFNDDWTPVNADTENTDRTQRDLIKARARYLENNSDIANAAIGALVRNVVGIGIKPQARTADEKLNKMIEALWELWCRPENCDITGQQTFYEMQAMLLRRKIVDGEIFLKKVTDKNAAIPFKLQLVKSDLLDNYLLYAPKSNRVIRSGIELNEYLKPVAYWIKKKSLDGYIEYDPDRVPADQIIHLWNKVQPDQIRGMSDLTPIIKRIKDTADYLDAETVAAKIAACFSVFITTEFGAGAIGRQPVKRDKEGKPLKSIRPGMVKYLNPGEKVETANPTRSITSAKDFIAVQERLAGSGLGLSYEMMSRDFQKASFSSARQGALEDRKTFEPMQIFMASHLCQPVYEEFLDAAVLSGRLMIPDYWQRREEYQKVQWVAPGWSWIDPEKEVDADIKAIQNGGKTMAQWCAERGYDWREQLEQMALEKQTAESLGLTLSIHTPESVQAAESNHTGNKDKNNSSGNNAEHGDSENNEEGEEDET